MIEIPHKVGPWNLSELEAWPKHGKKVFSCFHCGGGSTMGYKLAGFDVLGGVEIDPEMMGIYKANHNPKLPFLMGVEDFNKIPNNELPRELFNLDILDGSPPCSSFSLSGSREKKWGKETKFREGQAVQVLDDLFFHFIETARKLQPRVVIAENVKGLIVGNARGYVKQIFQGFKDIGYECQLFLLNASFMGVPQRRERTFFIAIKIGEAKEKLVLNFQEPEISIESAIFDLVPNEEEILWLTEGTSKLWKMVKPGQPLSKAHAKGHRFNALVAHPKKPAKTMAASADSTPIHWASPRRFTGAECIRVQTFPDDFNFMGKQAGYVCGMSVPPFMMQRVALEVYKQWLE